MAAPVGPPPLDEQLLERVVSLEAYRDARGDTPILWRMRPPRPREDELDLYDDVPF